RQSQSVIASRRRHVSGRRRKSGADRFEARVPHPVPPGTLLDEVRSVRLESRDDLHFENLGMKVLECRNAEGSAMKTRTRALAILTCGELIFSVFIVRNEPVARDRLTQLAQCYGCGNGNGNGNVGILNGNGNGNYNSGAGNGNGNGNGNGAPQTNGNLGFMNGGTGNIGAFNGLGNSSPTSGNNNIGAGNGNFNGSTYNGNGNVGAFNGNFNGIGNVGTGNGSNNGNGNIGALNGNFNGSFNQ
ncbi:MAG: hypothetical protein KGM94_13300, partial [Bradyrhizobium sp.]|nr:hypothetical protein [Bradyrhizobium sp.]